MGPVEFFVSRNGLLKRAWESADGKHITAQLIVSRKYIADFLKEIHSSTSGRHFGENKMLGMIRHRFHWVQYKDVENWCRKCFVCAATKGPKTI